VWQPRFGVRISPELGRIFHWNSHIRDSHRCQEEVYAGLMARFARLRSLQTFEQGQKQTSTCSTRPGIARERPGARPRAHRAAPSQTRAPARANKANRGFNRTPPLALNLAGVPVHRRLLCAWRASGHPRTDHRRLAILAIPRPVWPSRESPRVSVKLPEPGIELYLAGDTRSTSPDLTRSPAYVDRAPRWVFLQFLAWVDSLAPRKASRALGLNPTAVSRPEHTLPTSPTACARGPTDSGHHRRWAVPRRDRKDFSELTPPFAGPPSPSVSRVALFTSAVTVEKGGGTSGRKEKKSGGFEWSETQVNSCAGA
jgi:hypothetical protein